MIERHTCYYRVNDSSLYREIINRKGFDEDMKAIGIFKRKITMLVGEEFEGIFEIDPVTHPNKGFEYFKSRGVEFLMTRPSIVEKLLEEKELRDTLDKLKQAVAV
ncbi:hypothetical protein [uncultured Mediterranean phage uvMED]|nr:hypothetical protein [uncultured Mediterranean phage uvMED]